MTDMTESTRETAPSSADKAENTMTTLIWVTPYVASIVGAAMLTKALCLYSETTAHSARPLKFKRRLLAVVLFTMPALAQAQGVDLRTATESGNAIIMYLCGFLAAIGIVTAGVTMMMGRPTAAKWSFAGAMVSGLAFAIVRTMWSNMGLEAAGVSTFAP
jgi:hypothetical protein